MDERPDTQDPAMPVAQAAFFEGERVTEMEGKLPSITLEMPEGYPRGTHLRMMVEVRVRNVRYEEITKGPHKGDLVRQHVFALEEVQLVSAFGPEQVRDDVGGSASAHPTPSQEESQELGVQFGRSSDQWDPERYRKTGTGDVGF